MMRFGLCCCCNAGAVIDRWLNTTKVRPNDDSGGTHYTCDPYARFVEGIKEAPSHEDDLSWCEDQTGCTGCGTWLQGADANGYSAQQIQSIVDDIMACASDDATHQQLDHNCYEKSGTVDTRVSGRRGGRWILGKKFWHGAKGIRDRNDPHQIISIACTTGRIDAGGGVFTSTYADATAGNFPKAYQVRYLKSEINGTFNAHYINASTGGITDYDATITASAIVGRWTGLQTKSGSAVLLNDWTDLEDAFDTIQGDWNTFMATFASFVFSTVDFPDAYVVQNGDSTYELWTGGADDYLTQTITVGYGATTKKEWLKTLIDGSLQYKMFRDESLSFTNTGATLSRVIYSYAGSHVPGNPEVEYDITETLNIRIELSDPYTSADCLKDYYSALRAWNLANNNLHYISAGRTWRRDEVLALAPLVIYDEVQSPVTPAPSYGSIDLYGVPNTTYSLGSDDYEQAQDAADYLGRSVGDPGYIPTWHKRPYLDPAGYIWQAPDGSRGTGGTASSTLLGPMRSGSIIAAGIEGGERLFWFNADNYERVQDSDLGDPSWHWNQISNGALSDTRLPETTRRWMNLDQAQYDAAAYRGVDVQPPSGNYPQSFLRQQNGVLVGAKYVEATQSWPAVDFDYPCGDARFDVDQETVCCIVSGDASTGFRVKQTGNSTSTVPSAGNKILAEGYGVYEVTSVDSHGGTPAEWTLHVGSKIEDIPVGRSCWPNGMDALGLYGSGSHLGKLRWWTATPTDCVTPNPVSNRTGVKLEWTFNARLARLATANQPLWLGGTAAGDGTGIVGCTGLSMSEFTFNGGSCPAVVGWVPFYSKIINPASIPNPALPPENSAPVENFTNQTLFAMPDVFLFDDTYGALWMGAVEMVMPDPFWQTPYTPDCDIDYTEVPRTEYLQWHEDNGSGADDYDVVGVSSTTHHAYYPHRKWVAARCTIPAGKSLPSGIELFYATGSAISPADGTNVHYDSVSGGIVLGANDGSYRSIERPWGFTDRACADPLNRFGDFYETFNNCP